MVRRIVIILFWFMLITLIVLWLITGGARRIGNASTLFTNPINIIFNNGTSTGFSLKLPWQPTDITQGPDLNGYGDSSGDTQAQDPQARLDELQSQYGDLSSQANEAKTFGNPSPERGTVTFGGNDGAVESDLSSEYVELHAKSSNTSPVSLAGWSLESALTGARVYLPQAAAPFISGIVNTTAVVYLNPGADAIVTTGASPVGPSFRENLCTGYLAQFQTFTPELSGECPDPSASLPLTPDNVHQYGSSCIDYAASVSPCAFPTNLPSDLTAACKAYVTNVLSYNGCVNTYRAHPDFERDTWRLYISSATELWGNTHDIIRLLDANGLTVDVMSY